MQAQKQHTELPEKPKQWGAAHGAQDAVLFPLALATGVPSEALTTPALLSQRERREKLR